MKRSYCLIPLLCIVLATPCLAAPTVFVNPATNVLYAGEEFEVAVEVNAEVGDLSCFALSVQYDPLLLEIVSSAEGALFTASPEATFFQQEQVGPGEDAFSDCVLGFGTSVNAPGEIFRIRFKALTAGSSAIDLLQAELRDVDRALIPGVVAVDGSADLSLTATTPRSGSRPQLLATPNPSAGSVLFELTSALSGGEPSLLLRNGLEIYDVAGRRVRNVGLRAEGEGLRWDARDGGGRRLASGMYFVALRQGGRVLAKTKLLLVD